MKTPSFAALITSALLLVLSTTLAAPVAEAAAIADPVPDFAQASSDGSCHDKRGCKCPDNAVIALNQICPKYNPTGSNKDFPTVYESQICKGLGYNVGCKCHGGVIQLGERCSSETVNPAGGLPP